MNNIAINKLLLPPFLVLCVVLLYLGLIKGFVLFLPFILGYLVSKAVSPLADWIVKHTKLHKGFVVGFTILSILALGGFLIYLIGLGLVDAVSELAKQLPTWSRAIMSYAEGLFERFKLWVSFLPQDGDMSLKDAIDSVVNALSTRLTSFASKGISVATSLPGILIGIVVTILSAFFFSKDSGLIRDKLGPVLYRYIGSKPIFINFKRDILAVIWGYLKAQLTLMSVTTTVVATGLAIIGVNNALALGLLAGIVDSLPILGPAAFFMPWVAVMALTGQTALAIKLFVLYLVTTITRQLLEPKVLSAHIGVHPLLTLMGLYLGIQFFGFPGLILGPFTMVTLVASYKRYVQHQQLEEPAIMHRKKRTE